MTLLRELRGSFYPTAIGSLPHTSAGDACGKILKLFKDIPFWPQLVKRSYLENMYAQFSEGMPGIVIDREKKTIMADTSKDISGQIEKVYEKFLADDVEGFAMSPDYASGFFEFIRQLKKDPGSSRKKFLKGQITGPASFGLTVTDENKRAISHNPELKEAMQKTLLMKARWQIKKLKEISDKIIIFIDEPYLVSIGSSYVSLNKEQAFLDLNELIEGIHKEGALSAIHCCGNTDWGFVLGTNIDILNFDAYEFFGSITLYPGELRKFLDRQGLLAWGIVPSSQKALEEDGASLIARIEKSAAALKQKGFTRGDIMDSMIITPSCGCGTLSEDTAEAVFSKTVEISNRLKEVKNG
ncbi:MAG: hypothetical protein ABH825_01420 [Candidatus Omnitrophota bacterium]